MRARGFTLIELVITVGIVALLASAAVPLNELIVQRGKEQDLRRALRDIREAIDSYKQASDEGRIAKKPGDSGYPRRLEELTQGVDDQKSARKERMYFLRRIPPDPFSPERDQLPAATWGKRSYDSPAEAPREGADVFDVYSLSSARGINGVPYRQW
jgi:general secretion pathway protein G